MSTVWMTPSERKRYLEDRLRRKRQTVKGTKKRAPVQNKKRTVAPPEAPPEEVAPPVPEPDPEPETETAED